MCPICNSETIQIYYKEGIPKSETLPVSREESRDLPTYTLNMYECVNCGHVYNASFIPNSVSGSPLPDLRLESDVKEHSPLHGFQRVVSVGDLGFFSHPNRIVLNSLDDYQQQAGSLLILRDYLNRVASPRTVIESLSNLHVLVQVPIKRFDNWVYEQPHVFTPESLKLLFNGWRINYFRQKGSLSCFARHVAPIREKTLQEKIDESKASLPNQTVFLGSVKEGVLVLQSLVKSGDIVADKETYGRYLPGTEIQIIHPEGLRDIDTLVIINNEKENREELSKLGLRPQTLLLLKDYSLESVLTDRK